MKILLTNDDGIDAPGIAALKSVAAEFGEVWVFAPADHVSGASHQLSLNGELKIEQRAEREFAVHGFPTDCIRVAFSAMSMEFDWVLSGVNNGGNLGTDIYMSGTVAAAREAALLGCHGVAFSQHRRQFMDPNFDWGPAGEMARRVLSELLATKGSSDGIAALNVNFPDVDLAAAKDVSLTRCELDRNPLPFHYEREGNSVFRPSVRYNERSRTVGRDVDVCFSGEVSITGFDFVSLAEN